MELEVQSSAVPKVQPTHECHVLLVCQDVRIHPALTVGWTAEWSLYCTVQYDLLGSFISFFRLFWEMMSFLFES